MHTLDGYFACWTATTRADKCGAASSWPTPKPATPLSRGSATDLARSAQRAPKKILTISDCQHTIYLVHSPGLWHSQQYKKGAAGSRQFHLT